MINESEQVTKRAFPSDVSQDAQFLEPSRCIKQIVDETKSCVLDAKEIKECPAERENFEQKLEASRKGELKEYKSLMFRGTLYVLNDFVYIRESHTTSMVSQLKSIIPQGGNPSHPHWPMVKVKW